MARKTAAQPPERSTVLNDQQIAVARYLAYSGYVKGTRVPRGCVTFAAKQVGVTRQAIYLWLQIPEFVDEIESTTAEGVFRFWNGLFVGADNGNAAACDSGLARLQRKQDPKLRIEQEKHRLRLEERQFEYERQEAAKERDHQRRIELMKIKADLGQSLDDGPVEYRVVYTETGETPPPEERH